MTGATGVTGAKDRLIVALDVDRETGIALADGLSGVVGWLKVGMTLYYAEGPSMIAELRQRGFDVFIDLKLHDIPHQARGAARSLGRLGAGMLTVHASGGPEMIAAAVEGAREGASSAGLEPPAVLAVTVLTSTNDEMLSKTGVLDGAAAQVDRLARLAISAGADGIVCSPLEIESMRQTLGAGALIVAPGVRPVGAAVGDQARVATPAQAIVAGASRLVVGRPIVEAEDPIAAAMSILAEIEGAL
jgi:orotidine-5'-phosphate decarboxylase